MKFPTYKELGEIAAKEALDTFEYKGKTLREWIEIISAAELGTNLAEVGTDLISRQAVTKFLNDWLSCLFENCHKQSASDLKMIIKDFKNLPSAQPDTTIHDSIPTETGKNDGDGTSGDCISRQQAIDALKEKVFHNLSDEFYGAMQVLDELPSAQPERKTGRWIESNPQNSKLCRLMTCSECGKAYIVNINVPYEDWTEAHKFCVECGAKMEGGEADE